MRGKPLLVMPVLMLALAGIYQAAGLFQQDLAFSRAQTEVSFWGRGDYQPSADTIALTSRRIDALLHKQPQHPEYLGLQANYAAWQAYWAEDGGAAANFNRRAVSSQYLALESRPAHRQNWAKMVEYAARTATDEALLQQAQARLLLLQPKQI